jgi:hypothetical protein
VWLCVAFTAVGTPVQAQCSSVTYGVERDDEREALRGARGELPACCFTLGPLDPILGGYLACMRALGHLGDHVDDTEDGAA